MKCECGSAIDSIDQMKEHRRLCQRPVAKVIDLLSINYSTHGDFSFNVPAEKMGNFIDSATGNREKMANFLDKLAEDCRTGTYPFTQTAQEAHGPVDFM